MSAGRRDPVLVGAAALAAVPAAALVGAGALAPGARDAALYGSVLLLLLGAPVAFLAARGPRRTLRRHAAEVVGVLLLAGAGLWATATAGSLLGGPVAVAALLAVAGSVLLRRGPTEGAERSPWQRLAGTRAAASVDRLPRGPLGTALILLAAVVVVVGTGGLQATREAIVPLLALAVAGALLVGPRLRRQRRAAAAERAARVRECERAELAAHLHDSVLQTLALIRRRAEDPRAVATLARRQERELRLWLSGRATPDGAPADLVDALRHACAELELEHGVEVEVVATGGRTLDDAGRTLLAAAREAVANAVRHAGAGGPVAVFVEADARRAEVDVRDRGPGFDPAAVPADRRGVRESIVGRMERAGGSARIGPAPGGGTEVELVLEWRG